MTDKRINYVFSASGHEGVRSVFKSIAQAANDSTRAVTRSGAATARAVERDAAKTAKAQQREAEKAARAQQMASERAAKAEVRTAEKLARDKTRIHERAEKDYQRGQAKRLREMDRQARIEERIIQRKHEYERASLSRMGGRVAGYAGNAIGSAARWAAGTGMAALGVAAGAGVMASRSAMSLQEQATRAAIAGRMPGQEIDPTALRKRWENAAIASPGVTAEEVGSGYSAFVGKTGNAKMAEQMLDTWATAASATGSRVEDLAAVTADLFQKFDISSVEGMRDAFAELVFQGKKGSFELKDAANLFPRLAAAAGAFGVGSGISAVQKLGGLTQIARTGTGSSEQAATAIERVFANLTQKQDKLKTMGVDVFDSKTGRANDVFEILSQTIAKAGGKDMGQKRAALGDLFGEEGIRAVNPMLMMFAKATEQGKDGLQAVRDALEDASKSGARWGDVVEDAANAQSTAGSRLTAAWERIKAVVGDRVVPVIAEMASRFGDWLDTVDMNALGDAVGEAASLISDLSSAALDAAEAFGLIKRDTKNAAKDRARAEATLSGMDPGDKAMAAEVSRQVERGKGVDQAVQDVLDVFRGGNAGPGERKSLVNSYRRYSGAQDTIRETDKAISYDTKNAPKSMDAAVNAIAGGMRGEDLENYWKHNTHLKARLAMAATSPSDAIGITQDPKRTAQFIASSILDRPDLAGDFLKNAPFDVQSLIASFGGQVANRTGTEKNQIESGVSFDKITAASDGAAGELQAVVAAAQSAARALGSIGGVSVGGGDIDAGVGG